MSVVTPPLLTLEDGAGTDTFEGGERAALVGDDPDVDHRPVPDLDERRAARPVRAGLVFELGGNGPPIAEVNPWLSATSRSRASVETLPYDINERGEIVGRFFDGTSEQAFMRDRAGRFTTLRIPDAQSAWASGINNNGQIVGIYSENTPNVKDPTAKQHGFCGSTER